MPSSEKATDFVSVKVLLNCDYLYTFPLTNDLFLDCDIREIIFYLCFKSTRVIVQVTAPVWVFLCWKEDRSSSEFIT